MAVATLDMQGGVKLTNWLQQINLRLHSAARVNVGFLSAATYPKGAKAILSHKKRMSKKKRAQLTRIASSAALKVATVAFWNEFGRSGQVPRPFFRNMIHAKSPSWGRALAKNLKATHYDAHRTLSLMGTGIKDQLVRSINNFSTPALRPSTVHAKGFAHPLIDHGIMLNSIDFQVRR